ncbi:MAG: hypothetical protein C4567_07960 [Deltaproteobacteria bacterium]|nr:MAG: hypothetical protein C4567_07960 [Deltaproteobacteria bacterium]
MSEKKLKKVQRDLEWEQAKSRLCIEMSRHFGKNRAIGAGELFEIVFLEPYQGNKITGTRRLRRLIEEVKYGDNPMLIAFSCCTIRPGYYIPDSDGERREFFAREEKKVKKKIGRLARLNRLAAGVYANQLALSIQAEGTG